MENFWSEFILKNGGEYNARFEFDSLCLQLLSYHYPGRKLINANKIDDVKEDDNLILVYLPKFFFDKLTNSRKSQIRKAFNHTLEVIQDKKIKISKWVLCTPYHFDDDDYKWWNQWKYKNFDAHNIEIDILQGKQILDLLKKYKLDTFTQEKTSSENVEQSQAPEPAMDFEFDLPSQEKNQQRSEPKDAEQPLAEKNNQAMAMQPEKQNSEHGETEPKSKAASDQTEEQTQAQNNRSEQTERLSQDSTEKTSGQHQEKQAIEEKGIEQASSQTATEASEMQEIEQKSSDRQTMEIDSSQPQAADDTEKYASVKLAEYYKIRDSYLSVISAIESLTKEEKEQINRLRAISDFDPIRFTQTPDEKDAKGLKTLDLYFKAKTNEVDRKYDQALFYYELLDKRKDDLQKHFKSKAKEVEKSYREVKKQLVFEQKILSGDLLQVKDRKLEALENYEEALRLKPKEIEAIVKYNELLGDMLMESGLYKEAQKAYSQAMGKVTNRFRNIKKRLQTKRSLAKTMSVSAARIPVIAQLSLFWARFIDINNDFKLINAKELSRLKKSVIATTIVIVIAIFAVIIAGVVKSYKTTSVAAVNSPTIEIWNLHQAALTKGDWFMKKYKLYGVRRIHVLDSAVRAYRRAFIYDRNDAKAMKKYQLAKTYLNNYIKLAKQRLKQNPARYYHAVKPMSEGLQLVKYTYDPQKPYLFKFGYIDQKHNLVIPPLYDFDYNRRMKPGQESFHSGHAYVCIIVRPGDTAYFQINRFGRRTSPVYWINGYRK